MKPISPALVILGIVSSIALLVSLGWGMMRTFQYYRTHHPYTMSNTSMTPTIYKGDQIEVDDTFYDHHAVARGDLIAFQHKGIILVKRVVALGGDTVECNENKLVLNGAVVAEPYAHYDDSATLQVEQAVPPTRVPADQLFVTGDWRTRSLDSRKPDEFGVVHRGDVIGRVVGVRFSAVLGQSGRTF